MERYTFPNQRFVCVHRERPTANFLEWVYRQVKAADR